MHWKSTVTYCTQLIQLETVKNTVTSCENDKIYRNMLYSDFTIGNCWEHIIILWKQQKSFTVYFVLFFVQKQKLSFDILYVQIFIQQMFWGTWKFYEYNKKYWHFLATFLVDGGRERVNQLFVFHKHLKTRTHPNAICLHFKLLLVCLLFYHRKHNKRTFLKCFAWKLIPIIL